jgi:hypothetical protein
MDERGLRRALAQQQVIKIWQGAYCLPSAVIPPDELIGGSRRSAFAESERAAYIRPLTRLAAAELTLERPVIACLQTAAELYGFALEPDFSTHVLGPSPSTRHGLSVHRMPHLQRVRHTHGFGVTGPAETAVRLAARTAKSEHGLALLDAALRSGYTSTDALGVAVRRLGVAGVHRVRILLPLADGRAESPGESWLRWVCHDAGFPALVPQFVVTCRNGTIYRIDLAWPQLKLGLEYDGVEFHTGKALTRDRTRLNALTRAGWTIQSVTAPMLWAGRGALIDELKADLRQRGAL